MNFFEDIDKLIVLFLSLENSNSNVSFCDFILSKEYSTIKPFIFALISLIFIPNHISYQ